ncbi:multidrug efflux protein, partial [Salmonella enterica subsp. enterica serovar Newport str. WA_14881]
MNTNVYENTDSETITPLNKRRILPVFLLVGLYAASTAAVMSVLPFYIREMGGSPLIIGIIIATEAFSQFCAAPLIGLPFRSRWPQANIDCHAGYCGD